MTICIIPARSKSKRIKNKNIKHFNKKPIISYAIMIAKKSKLFERIIVSTDSKKIAKIAIKYGAEVPFLRKRELSDDYTNTPDVLIDAIKNISSFENEYHFCLYPTAALITTKDMIESLNKIKRKNSDVLIAITNFNQSPMRALKINGDRVNFNFKKFAKSRTQDTPILYRDTGTFYIYKTKDLLIKRGKLTKNSTYYYLNNLRGIDIDNEIDFQFAEFIYKKFNKKII